MKKILVIISVLFFIGCGNKKETGMWHRNDSVIQWRSMLSFHFDSTYAEVDDSFHWEIKGDTLQVMDSMAAWIFRNNKRVVLIYTDKPNEDYTIKPGDTIRITPCKN